MYAEYRRRYKIDINAQQNHLTGITLLTDVCNLIVVEGGPKAQRRWDTWQSYSNHIAII